jgi:hypothetical protein
MKEVVIQVVVCTPVGDREVVAVAISAGAVMVVVMVAVMVGVMAVVVAMATRAAMISVEEVLVVLPVALVLPVVLPLQQPEAAVMEVEAQFAMEIAAAKMLQSKSACWIALTKK